VRHNIRREGGFPRYSGQKTEKNEYMTKNVTIKRIDNRLEGVWETGIVISLF
jgi:hypothetical protein